MSAQVRTSVHVQYDGISIVRLRYDASEINVPLWVRDSECRGQYCYTLDVHRLVFNVCKQPNTLLSRYYAQRRQVDYGYSGCLTYANDTTQTTKLQLTGRLSLESGRNGLSAFNLCK